jgi:hypothetical protein
MDKNSVWADSVEPTLHERLAQISQLSREVSQNSRTEASELLEILRTLELLHREIREDLFQNALPTDRHSLYRLLRDIEENGGWPYIARLRLQDLLTKLPGQEEAIEDNGPVTEP